MLNNPHLIRYWFVFEENEHRWATVFGVGVTAYSYDDALNIIGQTIFKDSSIPQVMSFTANFDVSTITDPHIWTNMLPSNFRGVWYPTWYQALEKS